MTYNTPRLLVLLAALALAVLLAPELPPVEVHVSDLVLHLSLARGLAYHRTLDFWHTTDLGYPVLRIYQPLWHLAVATADLLTGGRLGIEWWAQASTWLLALATPLGLWLGARRWLVDEGFEAGRAEWIAACVALLGAFATSFSGFGFDPMQVAVRHAVVTQAWATVFFLPAFARASAAIAGRERSAWPGLALSFLVWGLSLIVGVLLFAAVAVRAAARIAAAGTPAGRAAPARAFALHTALLLAVTAWLWWPLVADAPWVHYPREFFPRHVHDGFGLPAGLGHLFSGRLLDGRSFAALARPPVLSTLFLFGLLRLRRAVPRGGGLLGFLLAGQALWLSFFLGTGVWGGLLGAVPLLSSYQWFRFEASFQLFAAVIAAIGVVDLWAALARRRGRTPALAAGAAILAALLAVAPARWALEDRRWLEVARSGRAAGVVAAVETLLAGDPARTWVGSPVGYERRLVIDGVWPGIALVARGVPAAGRIYQGMPIASQLLHLEAAGEAWRAELLGIGNYLLPCGEASSLPILVPAREIGPGVCLALAREPPPLAWFSEAAARPPVPLGAGEVLARQRAILAGARADVFAAFRLAAAPAGVRLPEPPPLVPARMIGHRFATVARGRSEARLEVQAPADGAIVFPVPYHPGLRAEVDGVALRPRPALPGYAAVPVGRGRHEVRLVYATSRVKDVLFLLGAAAVLGGSLAARGRGGLSPPVPAGGRRYNPRSRSCSGSPASSPRCSR